MYFENCKTVKEIKDTFRKLMFDFHPDRHPQKEFSEWNRKAQMLNAAYQEALQGKHETSYSGTDGKPHTYYYNEAVEKNLAEILDKLIAADLSPHISIEIIGTWLWISGTRFEDTEDRAKLNGIEGLRWHGKRKKWYWKPANSYRRSRCSDLSFDAMKNMYGSREVDHTQKEEEEDRAALAA